MDHAAIKEIVALALKASDNSRIKNHAGKVTAFVHGGDVIDMEYVATGRFRYRGQFTTQSIEALAAYTQLNRPGVGFVNAEDMSARIFFNLGDVEEPGHGDWTGTVKLKRTAELKAVQDIDGKKLAQKQLVEFIEDWASALTAKDAEGNDLTISKAIGAIRNIKIKATTEAEHETRDLGGRKSSLEVIEASSKDVIPHALVMKLIPYDELAQREVTLRLSVITSEDTPRIAVRILGAEALGASIADEFKKVLAVKIGDAATLTVGTFIP